MNRKGNWTFAGIEMALGMGPVRPARHTECRALWGGKCSV